MVVEATKLSVFFREAMGTFPSKHFFKVTWKHFQQCLCCQNQVFFLRMSANISICFEAAKMSVF